MIINENLTYEIIKQNLPGYYEFWMVLVDKHNHYGAHDRMYIYNGFYETFSDLVRGFNGIFNKNVYRHFKEDAYPLSRDRRQCVLKFNSLKELNEFVEDNPELMI